MKMLWAVAAVCGCLCGRAAAQPTNLPPGAHRVDPGVGDVGAVEGISRADLRKDMRQERGFGSVYRLELPKPMGGPGTASTVLMRMDGGVTAVFPESVYSSARTGSIPLVPPGTTFYIGKLPESFSPRPAPRPMAPGQVDLGVKLQANEAPPGVPIVAPPADAEPTMWNDDAYRQRLIGELLDRAAGAGR
jgi:hypothetical protein